MQLQADRRPEAAAATKTRGRRQRIAVIAFAVAAVVAIAITVPLAVHRDPGPPTPVAATRSPQPPVAANQPPFWQQAMAYQPGWLPDGVVEQTRLGAKNIVRVWGVPEPADWPGPQVQLSVFQGKPDTTDDVVDVNGVAAYADTRNGRNGGTDVDWAPKPGIHVQVRVTGGNDHRAVALRMARAVRSNGTGQFRPLVELGWCPFDDGYGVSTQRFGGSLSGDASCGRDQQPVADVMVRVSTQNDAIAGTPVTVRGRHGTYVGANKKRVQTVFVQLADGRFLKVSAGSGDRPGYEPLTKAQLIRVADTAVIHDAAYLDWIGKR